MRAIGEAGYVLTKSELRTLAGMAGCKQLAGVSLGDPAAEKDPADELESAVSGLEAKKYVVKTDEGYAVDRNISFLVKACCDPLAFVRFIRRRGNREKTRCYYFAKDIAVELDQDVLLADTYILTPMTSADKAVHNMEEFFNIGRMNGKLRSRMFSNTYNMDRFIIRRLLDEESDYTEDEALDALSGAGLEKNLARDLFYALRRSGESYSMLLIKPDMAGSFYSVDIFAGIKYMWKITLGPVQQGKAEISTGTREDMWIAAEQFIDIIKGNVFSILS